MLHPALALLLCLAPLAQDPPKEQKPDPKVVQAAIGNLEKAYESHEADACVAAIRAAAKLDDPEIARVISRGLREEQRPVRLAAVEGLRFSRQPKAFEELESFWKRDQELMRKDQELAASTLQAIGQFGNPRAIGLLSSNPFETPLYACIKARLMGLANIRQKESLEKIIGMMRLVGEQTEQNYMTDIRLALFRLTGQDLGLDPNQWFSWYENDRNRIEISKQPSKLPALDQYAWDSYWSPVPLDPPETPGDK